MNTAKNGTAVATTALDNFQRQLKGWEQEIKAMLPPNVSQEAFLAVAITAVKQNPDILQTQGGTLHRAICLAAQDGLLPDGREGFINVFNEKTREGTYIKKAQWMPITHGIRKRAMEFGISINAQVVYAADTFRRQEGDDPKIEHFPPPLGEDRGAMVGAYAIFRKGSEIVHREVMDASQIEKVRTTSRQANGLMWTKFPEEAWRKTVIRRGIKSVPCSEQLDRLVRRDDDDFDFSQDRGVPSPSKVRVVGGPPSPDQVKHLPPPKAAAPIQDATPDQAVASDAPFGDESGAPFGEEADTASAQWRRDIEGAFSGCETEADIRKVALSMAPKSKEADVDPEDWVAAKNAYYAALDRVGLSK